MNETIWITEYEMNGEEHSYISIGDSTDNDANSIGCYNTVAVGEEGEETYKEGRTWNMGFDEVSKDFIQEIRTNGYLLK